MTFEELIRYFLLRKKKNHSYTTNITKKGVSKIFESKEFYYDFGNKIEKAITNLDNYVQKQTNKGKKIAGYGAGGRGIMTLANMKTSSKLDFLIDKNPKSKEIYTPSSNIPVVGLKHLEENSIDEIIVFSYGYINEIKNELNTYGYQSNQIKSFIDLMQEGLNG